jgi:quinol monooxygenase YgiN
MSITWRAHPGEAAAIANALQPIMVRTRAAPGCLACSLSTKVEGHIEICYVAEWALEADLQRQIQSSDFAQLAEIMERATERPTVEFALPGGTRGLEYAKKIRSQSHAL